MKYMVTGTVTITITTDVEAASEQEAMRLAKDRPMGSIRSDSWESEEAWVAEELDGDATVLSAEVCADEESET